MIVIKLCYFYSIINLDNKVAKVCVMEGVILEYFYFISDPGVFTLLETELCYPMKIKGF